MEFSNFNDYLLHNYKLLLVKNFYLKVLLYGMLDILNNFIQKKFVLNIKKISIFK